ncbi:MAG: lipocalin-like domain-containing protein [Chloroflexota bacterium]
MMTQLEGNWTLAEWDCTLDDAYHNHPFGKDAQGTIMYANGRMCAFLMKPDRPNFAIANLIRSSDEERLTAVSGFVSYSGSYRVEGDQVIHSVEFSLLPNWIGTELIRTISWTNDDMPQLILSTPPEKTSSGKNVVNRLRWQRLL